MTVVGVVIAGTGTVWAAWNVGIAWVVWAGVGAMWATGTVGTAEFVSIIGVVWAHGVIVCKTDAVCCDF